jgi:DNA mismatch repair protein MutS
MNYNFDIIIYSFIKILVKMTPMQEQYNKIKLEYPNAIVLFRLGDFYEAFNEDAISISKILGITLTGRGKDEKRSAMAGIPHHALPSYLPKLIEAGVKIAIADQMEEASPGKLVERRVTKVITPGTVLEENSLDGSKNNFLCSIFYLQDKSNSTFGLISCDLSTGELRVFETSSTNLIKSEVSKIAPSEIICSTAQFEYFKSFDFLRLEGISDSGFEFDTAYQKCKKQLEVKSLKGFGIENSKPLISALGGLLSYLEDTQKTELKHIKTIKRYNPSDYMQLDSETVRNLELLYCMNSADDSNSLFGTICKCESAMGKRKLRHWILNPLVNAKILQERLDAVNELYSQPLLTFDLRELIKNMSDIERITARVGLGSANPKDINGLKFTIQNSLRVIETLKSSNNHKIQNLINSLDINKYQSIVEIIQKILKDDPSANINEGNIIRESYSAEIDELRSIKINTRMILAQMQESEIVRSGISSLKISFNSVFGYYIEVTRTHLDKVPENYIRKQTLANAERFITQELKELEEKILSAEEKLIKIELKEFLFLRDRIAQNAKELLQLAEVIAEIDVLAGFAVLARENQYIKPQISPNNLKFEIRECRHPVVEKLVQNFTPNSVKFSAEQKIHILTGPNMSGKSTFIRQVALNTLMAQIGSFVPAQSAEVSIVDRIFTRVGAGDNLAKGESTFMVEMTETANILNNATSQSLIILDEVGRGTSTYDGVAIAWSIIEYISEKIKCACLFATHYHELIELEKKYKNIKNFNVEVIEKNEEIFFKHKIIPGGTNKSYGVHVAKLAGVPKQVTIRANDILKSFEDSSKQISKKTRSEKRSEVAIPKKIHPGQLGLI